MTTTPPPDADATRKKQLRAILRNPASRADHPAREPPLRRGHR